MADVGTFASVRPTASIPPTPGPGGGSDVRSVALRADDSSADLDPGLIDACGEDPRWLCELAYDWSNGNERLAEIVDWAVGRPLTILLILLVAWIVSRIARRYVTSMVRRFIAPDRSVARRKLERLGIENSSLLLGTEDEEAVATARRDARASSIAAVVGSTITAAIWVIAILMVLGELDLNLGPLLASAGIAGVALGFGAQSLVKDCISGLFMLIEDQYGIGDIIDVGEAIGTVEEVHLRTTVLRSLDGTLWHVPNGEILRVGNKSQLWSTAVVDVDIAYDADTEQARTILLESANALCSEDEWIGDIIEEPQMLGVEMLGADGVTMRLIVKCAPGAQWALQRTLRERFKQALEAADIEIPFPQRTIWLRRDET